jgi:hypothetical protein
MSPDGAELPEMERAYGDVGENRDRLLAFIERQDIELVFTENIGVEIDCVASVGADADRSSAVGGGIGLVSVEAVDGRGTGLEVAQHVVEGSVFHHQHDDALKGVGNEASLELSDSGLEGHWNAEDQMTLPHAHSFHRDDRSVFKSENPVFACRDPSSALG